MIEQPPGASAFHAGNLLFRESYATTRDDACREIPILVVLPSELALHARGERRAYAYAGSSFSAAKATAHIAVALFALTLHEETGESRSRLEALSRHARGAATSLQSSERDQLANENLALLEACLVFSASALAGDRALQPGARAAFAREAGSRILRITELATSEQLRALHGAFESARSSLAAPERKALQVVVLGDHQARTRSLGMQYFQRRLGEPSGADDRITYGENIDSEAEALALVGTRRLDRAIAGAFFGDEKRLQRDVLGDAAKSSLDNMQLDPV